MSTGIRATIEERRAIAGEWFARRKKEIVFGAIIFIVATLSFGLGYLMSRNSSYAPIIIETNGKE